MGFVFVYETVLFLKSNQNFEYGCRKVTEAAEKQLRRLWHTTPIYVYPQMQEYAEKLASLLPDPLKVCFHFWKLKVERIALWYIVLCAVFSCLAGDFKLGSGLFCLRKSIKNILYCI